MGPGMAKREGQGGLGNCAAVERNAGRGAARRMAPIGADDEMRMNGERAFVGHAVQTDDAPAFLDQAGGLGAQEKPKLRISLALLRQEIEKIPLRHEDHIGVAQRQFGEVRRGYAVVADLR